MYLDKRISLVSLRKDQSYTREFKHRNEEKKTFKVLNSNLEISIVNNLIKQMLLDLIKS